jgi:ATP-binding cassette subfamily B multidrug efflux pump
MAAKPPLTRSATASASADEPPARSGAQGGPSARQAAPEGQGERALPSHPLRYLARYRRWIVLGILCLVVTNVLAQAMPWVVKLTIEAIGKATKGAAASSISWLALGLIGIAIVQGMSRILSRIFIFNAGRDAEHDLRAGLFGQLCRLDGAFFRRHRTGDLMSRMTNDLGAVRAFFGAGVLHTVNTIFAYAVALPLMISIDGGLTFWALLPYPVLLLGARAFARGIYDRSKTQQEALAAMTTNVQEDLAGIRELKSYRLEQRRSETFEGASRHYLRQAIALVLWRTGMMPVVGAGAGASLVLILWLGGQRVIAGDLGLGDLVAFNLYIALLAWPTMAIGWMLSLWQRGTAAWHRLGDILGAEPELRAPVISVGSGAPPSMGLELRDLRVTLGEREVLAGIDLKLDEGQVLGVVGRVGSGKTVLAETVARLVEVPQGVLLYGGCDATALDVHQVRQRIAYAPQDPFLFSATLAENIAFGLSEADELDDDGRVARVDAALEAAGLGADIEALPDGLDTLVGERGIGLSGGQRQRVALARAIASDRPLLILDDSLSAVDAETEERILAGLRRALAGRTALLISHRLSALAHADRVLVLDEGRIVEQGTPSELLAAGGLYAQLYQRQQLEAAVDLGVEDPLS